MYLLIKSNIQVVIQSTKAPVYIFGIGTDKYS